MGHEKLPTLRRQLRDRHPRKDRVVVEQHPQEDHLERLRHPRGGEHHEPVAEPAETFGLESGRVALGRHEVEPGRELRRQRARVVAPVKQLRHRGPPREVGAEIAIGLHHPRTRLGREPREQVLRLEVHVHEAPRRQGRRRARQKRLQKRMAVRRFCAIACGRHEREEMHEPTREHAVIAHEVDHLEPRLAGGTPQAAAELLQEHDLRFRGPEHHHAVDQRDVDALVEEVHHAEGFERAGMERGEGGHARVAPVARKHGRRGHAPLLEPIPGKHRMPPRTAEDERAAGRGGLPLGPEAFHAGSTFQGGFELAHIKAAVAPRDPLEVDVVLEPPIPKRHERPLRDPVADRGLGREDVVEERGHVHAVGALGRGREAERERAFEAGQHAAVARGLRVVHLVDHAVIEGPGRGGC